MNSKVQSVLFVQVGPDGWAPTDEEIAHLRALFSGEHTPSVREWAATSGISSTSWETSYLVPTAEWINKLVVLSCKHYLCYKVPVRVREELRQVVLQVLRQHPNAYKPEVYCDEETNTAQEHDEGKTTLTYRYFDQVGYVVVDYSVVIDSHGNVTSKSNFQ